ncbi:MAG: beta-phosphoglucomutase [Saprospiraceae bacterium]|nr:beta-phosphoglucomutase [Saprospiraceae bacterium]
MIKACIFDLDGVIVDTAKYHYLAWKKLAEEKLGVHFDHEDNEHLKGVSRIASLEYILDKGNLHIHDDDKFELASLKNKWYVDLIENLDSSEILPGSESLLMDLKANQIKIALGSASKNAIAILKSIGLFHYFDFISDGNSTDKSKPDPAVFLIAAKGVGLDPNECIVFEDSIKGIEAAITGGFHSIGIGDPQILQQADYVVDNLADVNWQVLDTWFNTTKN